MLDIPSSLAEVFFTAGGTCGGLLALDAFLLITGIGAVGVALTATSDCALTAIADSLLCTASDGCTAALLSGTGADLVVSLVVSSADCRVTAGSAVVIQHRPLIQQVTYLLTRAIEL